MTMSPDDVWSDGLDLVRGTRQAFMVRSFQDVLSANEWSNSIDNGTRNDLQQNSFHAVA